jgi:hypothetical protein
MIKKTILSDGRSIDNNEFYSPILADKISDELKLDLIRE